MKRILTLVTILIFFTAYSSSFAQMSQGRSVKQQPNNSQQVRKGGKQFNQGQSMTESEAKNIIQNYIDQNPSFGFEAIGYATFTTPKGTNAYVFELETKDDVKYMILINPNGFTLGPTIVKNY
ncbi:MAG: hypothetical protein SVN78_09020 [Deferribacterota bacterium]|nr:hypothetical protein [Deferribacterota bacterium]